MSIEVMKLPQGITRDDTEHGVIYYTEAQLRQAIEQAQKQQDRYRPAFEQVADELRVEIAELQDKSRLLEKQLEQAQKQELNLFELLAESKQAFERNFGKSVDADWVYSDLEELFKQEMAQKNEVRSQEPVKQNLLYSTVAMQERHAQFVESAVATLEKEKQKALVEQVQKQGCTRSHPHEEMNKECELRTEIARLTNCLSRANALAERFERESYLLGDELEKLQAQKQEPVAWLCEPDEHGMYGLPLSEGTCTKCFPVYREPPQQSTIVRQPLTDEQIQECWLQQSPQGLMSGGIDFARAIEAAHGIKE